MAYRNSRSKSSLIGSLLGCLLLASFQTYAQTPELDVNIVYVEQKNRASTSLVEPRSLAGRRRIGGAMLGIIDGNTTGRFLGRKYSLDTLIFEVDEPKSSRDEKIQCVLAEGSKLVFFNVPADDLLSIVSLDEAKDDLFLNAQSSDKSLRNEDCQVNLLHTIHSRAMHGDALMQFFTKKGWKQIVSIEGIGSSYSALADAMRRSIKNSILKF